ncbi:terpenoid synthase [Daedaleopsis nitida]|nr:terpenoid synthase [Daedaleopsis nitida]
MARWPLPRRISPFYEEVAPESAEWLRSFHLFTPDGQTMFDEYNSGLLVALAYPDSDKEYARAACDFMNMFFVCDDLTDEMSASEVRTFADMNLDALRNPFIARPAGEPVFGEIMRQFWANVIRQNATESCQARFIATWTRYLAAVVEQAKDRDEGRKRRIEEHLEVRRYTIGAEPCFAFAEFRLNLPDELVEHPLLHALRTAVTEMIFYSNDLTSYSKELAAGDVTHSFITIAMREYGLDLDGAANWVAEQYKAQAEHALAIWPEALALCASYPKVVGEELAVYIDHIMNWPRANDCWSYEGGRYFGKTGLTVQKSGIVELSPKKLK